MEIRFYQVMKERDFRMQHWITLFITINQNICICMHICLYGTQAYNKEDLGTQVTSSKWFSQTSTSMMQVEESQARQKSKVYDITTKGKFCSCFLSMWVLKNSNEAEGMTILEALKIFSHSTQDSSIVENDSSNAISWVTSLDKRQWIFQFI